MRPGKFTFPMRIRIQQAKLIQIRTIVLMNGETKYTQTELELSVPGIVSPRPGMSTIINGGASISN